MDTKKKEELEMEKRILETQVLKLQVKHFDSNKKRISIIGTLIVSLITISMTIMQVWTANITKEKEMELAKISLERVTIEKERLYKLELARFISENRKIIFSDDTIEQKQIMNVMAVTFPPEIIKATFSNIAKTKDISSKSVWQEGVDIADKIIQVEKYADVTIHYSQKGEANDVIYNSLKDKGLNIVFEKSKHDFINAIWVSEDIDIELVRLIATSILENGGKLEVISYLKGKKTKLVNIGNHGSKKAYPSIPLEDILEGDDFIK